MSQDGEVLTYSELVALGEEIQELAAEVLANELDLKNIAKDQGQNTLEDLFGIGDYWAEDFMGEFAGIPYAFAEAAGPNPDQLDGVIEYLSQVSRQLNDENIQEHKENIKDNTFDWEGDGALNYRMFIRPLYICSGNQLLLVDTAIILLRSFQEVLRQNRRDLKAIGEETKSALKKIYDPHTSINGALLYAFNMLVDVVVNALPIASVPLKIGLVMANRIWGEVSSQISSKIEGPASDPPPAKTYHIGSSFGYAEMSTRGVIEDMWGAIRDLKRERQDNELVIASKFMDAIALIDKEGRDQFEAPRPNIADDMSQLTSSGKYGFGSPG